MFTHRGTSPLGPAGVRRGFDEAFSVAGKQIQPDTSAPTKRIAPSDFVALSRWDVVNAVTLGVINAEHKTIIGEEARDDNY
ncbi:hypothetical protein [Paenibacillus sp. KN14-4R]|uniref:hypothetical protein n=1 Tax=Paenibacillus sp. KN14-4R TaxID=3445773 RepID=UPI003F9F8EE0